MGFFAEFSTWLNAVLLTYIADQTALVAATLEPLAVTLGTLYLMVWAYLCLTGQIQEPLMSALKRFVAIAVVMGLAIHLWLYNAVIVSTVYEAPAALAAVIVGAFDAVSVVDQIFLDGTDAASLLLERGSLLDGLSFDLAGLFVYVVVTLTAAYAMFLLSLSKVALSVLLAVGPLFLLLSLFATTRRFLESWAAQLINYALITVMTTLVAALMLHVMTTATAAALSAGGEIQIAHGMRVCLAAALTLLVMRQVLPMCAGMSSGLALVTHNAFSGALGWALGTARRTSGDFIRGAVLDRETSRWDSLSRRGGFLAGASVRRAASTVNRHLRKNVIAKG